MILIIIAMIHDDIDRGPIAIDDIAIDGSGMGGPHCMKVI